MTHVHGQILAVRSDACISAGATEQRVADGGKPRDADQRPAEDYRHGQVVTRHTPVIPRLPHGFPILDDVQAAPLADGDNEGTRFRDERAQPCWFAFTGAWPAHSSIAFLLAASNAILMMFSIHAPGSVMNFRVSAMAAAISSSVISRDAPALYPRPHAHCRSLSMYDGSRCFCASISLLMMLIRFLRFVVECRFDSYAQVDGLLPSGLVAEHIRLGRRLAAQARYGQGVECLLGEINRFGHGSVLPFDVMDFMQHRFAGGDEYAEHTASVMAAPVKVEQDGMALTPLVDADGGDWDGFDQIGVSILAAVLDGDGFFHASSLSVV
nr:MAG TPA: hypothetical protein [Caudoviricetes sp.]